MTVSTSECCLLRPTLGLVNTRAIVTPSLGYILCLILQHRCCYAVKEPACQTAAVEDEPIGDNVVCGSKYLTRHMTAGVKDKEIAEKVQSYQIPNIVEAFPGVSSFFLSFSCICIATMSFNGANCILLPALEAVIAHYLLAGCLPGTSLTTYWLAFTILNNTVLIFHNMVLYPFFLSPLRNLPQPKGFIPLFGHGRLLLKKRQSGRDWHLQTMKTVPNDGIILRRGFLHTTRLILTTPAALADVLVHKSYDFEKPSRARRFLMRFLGEGLLLSEGEEHRFQRKRLAPAFHFRNVKELYPVFCAKSMEFCSAIRQ